MQSALIHPLQVNPRHAPRRARSNDRAWGAESVDPVFALRSHVLRQKYGMDGFFDDLFDTVWDAVEGLGDALSGALTGIVNTVKQLGETIALIVRAIIGDVSWDEVLGSLGEVFQDIGTVMVYLDPARQAYNWLSQAPLTSHCFNELDKFTGGMITTAANVSDLPWRAMRGDPISKQELLKDVIFIIQVVMIVFTAGAWVAVGVMIGTMVGREVCQHQTEAKDACMATFQIIGAAAGAWGSSLYSAAAEQAAWELGPDAYAEYMSQHGGNIAAGTEGFIASDAGYTAALTAQAKEAAVQQSTSILTHIAAASEAYITRVGIDAATQEAARLCINSNIVGDNECQILAQVAGNYVSSPQDQAWEDFLASEVARIGAEQLMHQWFPEGSREREAIARQWQIKYVDVPIDSTVIVQKRIDPKTFLLAAGALSLLMIGAS